MLYLISLGLWDEHDLSLAGVAAAKRCDSLYIEQYTAKTAVTPEKLVTQVGKPITLVERKHLEEDSGKLLEEAREKKIGLFVPGDALFATTHMSLILDCKKKKIPYLIVHASSILTAVGETGLSLYKFGEVVTIPRWTSSYKPDGFYDTIKNNKAQGMHSLLLLEIDMTPKEARKILMMIEKEKQGSLFSEKILAISKAGSPYQEIFYGFAEDLPDFEAPAVLLLPGRLNEFENEFLRTFSS